MPIYNISKMFKTIDGSEHFTVIWSDVINTQKTHLCSMTFSKYFIWEWTYVVYQKISMWKVKIRTSRIQYAFFFRVAKTTVTGYVTTVDKMRKCAPNLLNLSPRNWHGNGGSGDTFVYRLGSKISTLVSFSQKKLPLDLWLTFWMQHQKTSLN